jgi:hypothetical protein
MDIYKFFETYLLHNAVRIFQHFNAYCAMSVSYPTKCFLFHKFILLGPRNIQVFQKHAQNLDTLQYNSLSWDLQTGFNLLFKGLMLYRSLAHHEGSWMNGGIAPLVFNLLCPICFMFEDSIWYL